MERFERKKAKYIKTRLCLLQVLIIDERSQLISKVMAVSKHYIQKFVYNG